MYTRYMLNYFYQMEVVSIIIIILIQKTISLYYKIIKVVGGYI